MLYPEYLYCAFILGVIFFQIALILGAPWGRLTQGGKHKGALPLPGRFAAAASIVVLAGMALAILSVSGGWPHWPRWTGWAAVVIQGASAGLNWATPSAAERRLWGPITSLMFLLTVGTLLLR